MKRSIFMVITFFMTSGVFAQMKIVRLNTPTVNINGKECKVGDSFSKNSIVKWSSDKQTIIAKDVDGKMFRMSAAVVGGRSGFSVDKLIDLQKSYKHLSSRSIQDEVDAAGEYIIDDVVIIPIAMDDETPFTIEIFYKLASETMSYIPRLTDDKTGVIVDRGVFKGKTPKSIRIKMMCTPEGDDTFCVSDEIIIVPLEAALEEE